jgi:acetyl esterase/lipase
MRLRLFSGPRLPARLLAALSLGVLTLALPACDSGVDDTPTAAELAAVRTDWNTRDTRARGTQVEAEGTLAWGSVTMRYTVVSHDVAGARHVGAILVPSSLTSTDRVPVLVYTHGGYTGPAGFDFPVESLAAQVPGEPLRSQLIYVIPSYRGERIQVAGRTYTSGGSVSIGNYDVDDAMALLSVALDRVPQADDERVAVLGESRGGLVALEMGARDPRVDLVVEAFGTTDFRVAFKSVSEAVFAASVRAAVAAPDAPAHILTRSLLPLDEITVGANSTLTITADGLREARLALARTAPVNYVTDLPVTQVHHGTADVTADVAYSRALRDAFAAAGRPSGSDTFTYFEYPGGKHDVTTLDGYFPRVADAITRVLMP